LDIYDESQKPKICSIKGSVGHMMGAAGAVGLVAVCMIYRHGIFPPSPMSYPLDKECSINMISEKTKNTDFQIFLNHSFGFGGNNAVSVLKSITEYV